MVTRETSIGKTTAHRIARLAIFTGLVSVLVFSISFRGNSLFFTLAEPPVVRLRNFTLTYYRAPEHSYPPENNLDPYDSFQKDENSALAIAPTGTNMFSNLAQSTYHGYVLKTHKGNPVIAYQETPSRRQSHKSNCHGTTFMNGDYWLLGSQVDRILDDNDWVAIKEAKAKPGDVAVYRDLKGRITHTAKVVGRDDALHVVVNSKNGFAKEIEFVRAVEVVPY